jgi:DNA-binding response OmpR family regulator
VRIAVLEDGSVHSSRAASLLRAAGHQVDVFSRGRAFLRDLRRETYQLIMLGRHSADVSGDEVLRTIRGPLALATPVLFLKPAAGADCAWAREFV